MLLPISSTRVNNLHSRELGKIGRTIGIVEESNYHQDMSITIVPLEIKEETNNELNRPSNG